jgi:hypothetical protein
MAWSPSKELLEKIETLQNLMLARATGTDSAADKKYYKELREDLFQIPAVKQALPHSHVCRSFTVLAAH